MFTDEIEVLEVETDAIEKFELDLPKESASAKKMAEKIAMNNLFEDIDVDNIIVIGANKKNQKLELSKFVGGIGLTTGLDFSKLADENPDWEGVSICLASEEDLLFSKFFLDGEQNEETRNYRKNKKEFDEFEEEED